jgi:hypothetical protein
VKVFFSKVIVQRMPIIQNTTSLLNLHSSIVFKSITTKLIGRDRDYQGGSELGSIFEVLGCWLRLG